MKDDMPNVDISGIETLKKLKDDQHIATERLQKLEDMRKKVSQTVFDKVQKEYLDKMEALQQEAEPIKAKVRAQYLVLRKILEELQAELEAISLEKEELELRHTLGEFDQDFYNKETKNWEVKHMGKRAELDEAQEMKTLFLGAFDSPEELENAPDLATVPLEAGTQQNEAEKSSGFEDRVLDDGDAMPEEEEGMDYFEPPGSASKKEEQPLTTGGDEDDDLATQYFEPATEKEAGEAPDMEYFDAAPSDEIESLDDAVELEDDTDQLKALEDELPDDDIATELEELEEGLDDQFLDADDEEVGGESLDEVALPPVPDINVVEDELGTEPIAENDMAGGELPPLPDDDDADATIMMDPSNPPAPHMDQDPDGTMIISNPKIISLNQETEGQVIVLGMGTTSLGRSPDNDIHLTEDRISRKHSQIAFGPGGYALYDLNSENGTYVNGNRIREHFLSDGDIVMIGSYKYLYRDH